MPKIVLVEWADANFGTDEHPIDDCSLIHLQNVGWLIAEDPIAIKLDMEYCPGADSSRHWLIIPKSQIISMRELYAKRTRRPAKTRSKPEILSPSQDQSETI